MKNLFLIALLIFPFLLSSEPCTKTVEDSPFSLLRVNVKDFSRNTIHLTIRSNSEDELAKFYKKEKERVIESEFGASMNGKGLHQVNGSFYMSKENPFELEMDFRYIYDERLPLGENCIRLYDSKQAYDFKTLNIKSLYSGADEQPYIEKISPSGGSYGDTIQIVGRNFGKDIDNIQIVTLSGMKDEINQFGEDELDENIVPYYISDLDRKSVV